MLVRCPTVLQADVSLPLNVRSEIEVERDVDLVSAIYVYPADELVDDHLLRFKICTVVQVSIRNQFIIQVPVVMRFFSSFSISSNCGEILHQEINILLDSPDGSFQCRIVDSVE